MDNQPTRVLINLLAIARYDNSPDYPIQFMTTGELTHPDDDLYVLRYTEIHQDDDTGETEEARIELYLEKKRVTMIRTGDCSNTMVFVKGQRFEGTYRTPYGDMDMAVFPGAVSCEAGERTGSVHLKYQLDIGGAYASTNELHLEYSADMKGRKE